MNKARRVLVRQWELVRELGGKRLGLTVRQLCAQLDVSKQTLYRDLAALRDAGVPVFSSTSNGEARYRLLRDAELPALGLSALQIAALHVARAQLEPLAGTALVAELDLLLGKLRPVEPQQSLRFAAHGASYPRVMRVVEQGIETQRRLRIEYRAVSRRGGVAAVHVEPHFLRVAGGEPYFRGYCIERGEERTYKISRVAAIALTSEPATRTRAAPDQSFAGAIKAWSGPLTTVRVRLDGEVAWLAREYPLVSDQRVVECADGSALVEARVAGIVEATRRVLTWGAMVEALEPAELRAAVRDELAKALRKYDGPGTARTKPDGARGSTGRLTKGGTARA